MNRLYQILKELFYRSWDFISFISGEGSWKLFPHEELVLNAVKEFLPNNILESVNAQLNKNYFIQRMHSGRINTLFIYDSDDCERIVDDDYSNMLFKVVLMVNKRKQIAHVIFNNGLVHSIEFKKPKKFYAGSDIVISNIMLGKPSQAKHIQGHLTDWSMAKMEQNRCLGREARTVNGQT
jgi:hypothetical protein